MADVITGNTQLGATKQDLIAALVQKELKFNAKLLPFVSDVSMFAVKGAKSVSFPKLDSFTVQNRATATAGDIQALTAAADKLDLNINAYVSWLIDSMDEAQTTIEAQMEFAKRAAAAHARYVDEQIIAVAEAAAYLDIGAAPITYDMILDGREQLVKSFADLSQSLLLVGPDQEKAILKITEFKEAQVYGQAVIPNGQIGTILGLPVMVHQGVATGKAYMWSKEAIAIAFQKQPMMGEQPEIAYGVGAKRVAIDQLFGVKAMQLGQLGAGASQSPLIVKM